MRAFKYTQLTPMDELTLTDVPDPIPAPGEVLIRLKAAALNHRDLYLVNEAPKAPAILGSDGAGVIESSEMPGWPSGAEVIINPSLRWGERDDTFGPGWEILGMPEDGTLAEKIAVAADQVFAKPPQLSWEEAAALPLAALTAYRALFSLSKLQAGERVLIHGIGGGVAQFALQMAQAAGAQVMVTSTSAEKLARAAAMGASAVANARDEDWVEAARAWSGGGVDLVVESIGGEYFSRSMEALRNAGRLVSFGRSLDKFTTINVALMYNHHLTLIGSMMGSPRDFAAMLDFIARHNIRPLIDEVFPLEEVGAALRRLKAGAQFGKIVLRCE